MQPTTETDYKKLFSELIKKQMLVLGPDITMAKVKNIMGLTVDVNGDVIKMEGDPQQMLQGLINQFVELSGMIVKKTMESILTSYPGMMAMATSSAFGGVQASTQPAAPNVSSQTATIIADAAQNAVIQGEHATSQSPDSPTAVASSGTHTEPPPITSINMDGLSINSAKEEKPHEEPQAFSSKDMQDLNKALEELSKAPLSTETPSAAQVTPGQ